MLASPGAPSAPIPPLSPGHTGRVPYQAAVSLLPVGVPLPPGGGLALTALGVSVQDSPKRSLFIFGETKRHRYFFPFSMRP